MVTKVCHSVKLNFSYYAHKLLTKKTAMVALPVIGLLAFAYCFCRKKVDASAPTKEEKLPQQKSNCLSKHERIAFFNNAASRYFEKNQAPLGEVDLKSLSENARKAYSNCLGDFSAGLVNCELDLACGDLELFIARAFYELDHSKDKGKDELVANLKPEGSAHWYCCAVAHYYETIFLEGFYSKIPEGIDFDQNKVLEIAKLYVMFFAVLSDFLKSCDSDEFDNVYHKHNTTNEAAKKLIADLTK